MGRYLRNCWYMAGWTEEVEDDGLSRWVLGRRSFLCRQSDGSVAALLDRCPHRFAPLSLGTREGDTIICGYHGLRFAADGRCVHNLFVDQIPPGATVPRFVAHERDGIVWLWGGNAETADTTLIPDFSFIPDGPTNRSIRGYTLMHANYEYGTDNLMDLSHIEFVHKGSFAGQNEVIPDGDTLHSSWRMPGISPPSMARGQVSEDALVDHWLDMRWNAPASMRLEVGVCPHQAPRQDGFSALQAHILTPATHDETHYLWSSGRTNDLDDAEVDDALHRFFAQAFDFEDKPMIEAAYANVRGRDVWQEKPLFLGIDAGGTRARGQLKR